MNIIISGGYYATNIGNAFYEAGVKYVLEKCLGDKAHIVISSDKPDVYWASLLSGHSSALDYTSLYNADYVVIMGPMLSPRYLEMWSETFKKYASQGTRVVLMSAGANRYDDKEYSEVSRFLSEYRLYALLSRDEQTYQMYKDYFEYSYNGICCALYSCDYAPKYSISSEPYVVFNFDNCPEPLVVKTDNGRFDINGTRYDLKKKNILSPKRFAERLDGGELIIRTIHSVLHKGNRVRYAGPNCYISDVSFDYLNLYANADAVLTNRVHAAVVSLSYGTPVHLTNCTPRGNILKRIGCEEAYNGLFRLNPAIIASEKEKYEQKIREVFR